MSLLMALCLLRVLWSLLTRDYWLPDFGRLVWQGCHFLR